jgi:hypothetical protein
MAHNLLCLAVADELAQFNTFLRIQPRTVWIACVNLVMRESKRSCIAINALMAICVLIGSGL